MRANNPVDLSYCGFKCLGLRKNYLVLVFSIRVHVMNFFPFVLTFGKVTGSNLLLVMMHVLVLCLFLFSGRKKG